MTSNIPSIYLLWNLNYFRILAFIPLFEYVVYPVFAKFGMLTKPLQRIVTGGTLAGVSFVVSGKVHIMLLDHIRFAKSPFYFWPTIHFSMFPTQFWIFSKLLMQLPYACHYKPRLAYFFTPFPQTIYVLWPLALCMACIQERLLIKSGLWWRAYGI